MLGTPSAYHVERTLEVAAPVDLVFGILNDLQQFAGLLVLFGSPLEKDDPNVRMTIEESVPGQKVVVKLGFVKPMKSTAMCVVSLAGTPAGSRVTWSMDGTHDFIGRILGVFMDMDKMLGSDIEKGLARLETAVQGKALETR